MRVVIFCLFLVSVAFSCFILSADNTSAMTMDWSGEFRLESKTVPQMIRYNLPCDGAVRRISLSTGEAVSACVYGNTDSSRMANFIIHGEVVYALAKPYEAAFKVVDRCSGKYGCLYSYRYDILLEPHKDGVRIYRNFSDNPDRSSSEFVLEPTSLVFLPKIALSKNSRYAGVLMPKSGYFILDLDTVTVKQVYHEPNITSARYLLAVSSDGNTIAGYENTRSFVIAANDCGVSLGSANKRGTFSILDMCVMGYTIDNHFSFQRLDIEAIAFTRDSQRLRFDAVYNGRVGHVVIIKLGDSFIPEHLRTTEYFALGDSFTSGEGETDSERYIKNSDKGFEKCHLSDRSYPFLLASYWGVGGQNISCSGAVISDLVGSVDYKGQGRRLGSGGYEYPPETLSQKKEEAISDFMPGRVAQLDFVSQHNPEIISISVGGNDAGLMAKLSACLAPGTCDWASDEGERRTTKELRRLYRSYVDLFQEVAEAYPTTAVYVIGYPMPLYAGGSCGLRVSTLLNKQERTYIANTIGYLNSIMEAAASKLNLHYVDVEAAYEGYRICENASHPAMNFIRFGNDIAPFLGIKIIGAESLHPTPFGHELVFKKIKAQVPRPADQSFSCAYCDQAPDNIPPPSGLKEATVDTPVSMYRPDISEDNFAVGSTVAIKVPEEMFLKGSTVDVTIRSDPLVLASSIPLGSTIEVVVPDIDGGVHTLVVSGLLTDGEPLEIYKSIYVSSDQNDQKTDKKQLSLGNLISGRSPSARTKSIDQALAGASVLGQADEKLYRLNPVTQVPTVDTPAESEQTEGEWYRYGVWAFMYVLFFAGCGVCLYRYLKR